VQRDATLLFAEVTDPGVLRSARVVRCSFLPQAYEYSQTACEAASYWTTVTDNGPEARILSAELYSTSLYVNVAFEWEALGAIPIKRLDGQVFEIRINSRVIARARLSGYSPQSRLFRIPPPSTF
jgi:hypothetical protein